MATSDGVLKPDAAIEASKKDIDRTLLQQNLKLTTDQRLPKLQAAVRGISDLRRAFRQQP